MIMSEASSNDPVAVNPESDPMALREALQMIQRLASLLRNGELGNLVEAPREAHLTLAQAALLFQCSTNTLKKEALAGRFPHYYVGNQMRFHVQTVIEYKHRRYQTGAK